MSKQSGRMSQGANDFLAPGTPTVTSVADIGTSRAYNNGAVDVAFSATGVYAATSYTVLSSGGHTATGSSSPIRVEGLSSNTTYTFTVKATNAAGDSEYSTASSSVTATTVPAAPTGPTASSPSAGNDTFSWTPAPNGGKAITNYHWESNDSKSGEAGTANSVGISQEQGTAQQYRVYATNANGNSEWSSYSNSVTTTFSFVPFSVFGFSPFGVFGFSPFGFSPFGVFGFSPFGVFGFSPFGFSPFGVFGFSPFGFSPFGFSPFGFYSCVHEDTLISVVSEDGGYSTKPAKEVEPGAEVWGVTFDESLDESYDLQLEWTSPTITNTRLQKTTVVSKTLQKKNITMTINDDPTKKFSLSQPLLAKRDESFMFMLTGSLMVGDIVIEYSPETNTFSEMPVVTLERQDGDEDTFRFDCENADTFIAAGLVMHNKYKY
jgi:hypothetical protein